jgi:hypothetical protein
MYLLLPYYMALEAPMSSKKRCAHCGPRIAQPISCILHKGWSGKRQGCVVDLSCKARVPAGEVLYGVVARSCRSFTISW